MTAPEAVLETALYADDLDAAAWFYGGVIGLTEHSRVEGRHVFFRCGTGMVLIFDPAATRETEGPLPIPPHGATGEGHVCFRVPGETLGSWAARFADEGVEIESDFRWPNGARSIYVRDPARNSVEVSEPGLWAEGP